MRNNKPFYCFILIAVTLLIFGTPLLSAPQNDNVAKSASAEGDTEIPEPIKMDLIGPNTFAWPLLKTLPPYLKFLIIILLSAGGKVWLTKRRLKIPTKVATMDKLSTSSLAVTLLESVLMVALLIFFQPLATTVIAKVITLTSSRMHQFLDVAMRTVFIIPYLCVMGSLLTMLLIKFNTDTPVEKLKDHFYFGLMIAACTPVAYIALNFNIAFWFA